MCILDVAHPFGRCNKEHRAEIASQRGYIARWWIVLLQWKTVNELNVCNLVVVTIERHRQWCGLWDRWIKYVFYLHRSIDSFQSPTWYMKIGCIIFWVCFFSTSNRFRFFGTQCAGSAWLWMCRTQSAGILNVSLHNSHVSGVYSSSDCWWSCSPGGVCCCCSRCWSSEKLKMQIERVKNYLSMANAKVPSSSLPRSPYTNSGFTDTSMCVFSNSTS